MATPEIARLVAAEEFPKAVALSREARAVLPNDPTLEKLWTQATIEVSVESVPPGADVSYRPYRGDARSWEGLGRTPLVKVRVPKAFYFWRVEKPGFRAGYRIGTIWLFRGGVELKFGLDSEQSAPPEMVRVPGGKIGLAIPGRHLLLRPGESKLPSVTSTGRSRSPTRSSAPTRGYTATTGAS